MHLADRGKSVVITTLKVGGLQVYDLKGKVVQPGKRPGKGRGRGPSPGTGDVEVGDRGGAFLDLRDLLAND